MRQYTESATVVAISGSRSVLRANRRQRRHLRYHPDAPMVSEHRTRSGVGWVQSTGAAAFWVPSGPVRRSPRESGRRRS
jgi:hypothetical protein